MNADYYRQFVTYDPDTGLFRRLKPGGKAKVGDVTGWAHNAGYVAITVQNNDVLAHRLAWLLMTGEWPSGVVDHIDGNRKNNKWSNLRDCTHAENCRNRGAGKNSKSGIKGVSWHKASRKWRVQVGIGGRNVNVGYFDDIEQARTARDAATTRYHGEFCHD